MALYSSQIAKTLAEQVQHLIPLRESYRHLQIYYSQITNDLNNLLRSCDKSQTQLLANLKYLEEVHHGLEREFSFCGEELRQMDCQNARLQMEKNQNLAQAQALKSRQMLQLQQKSTFQNKKQQLIEQNGKLEFTIGKYKEMVHNIELVIKSKEYENIDIEREIKKMQLVNAKITQYNNETQIKAEQTMKANDRTVEEINDLENKLETYEKLIEVKEKQNKQNVQTLIAKTEQLEQLRHRKQYIQKLIDTQLFEQKELTKTHNQLESILGVKKDKISYVKQENKEYQAMIVQETTKCANSRQESLRLRSYLQTLIETNQILFKELERSCSQDRNVQIMLSQKLQKLLIVNDKIAQNDILNRCKTISNNNRAVLKDRTAVTQKSPPKEFTFANITAAKKNSSFTQNCTANQRTFMRSLQFSTTWGSLSKQNEKNDL